MKNKMHILLITLNILLILVFLAFLLNTYKGGTVPVQANSIQSALESLELISGEHPEAFQSGFLLVIFFHADGQCSCLEDWPNWIRFDQELGDELTVIGVFNGADKKKFLDFSKGVGLNIPLYADQGELRSNLGVLEGDITKTLILNSNYILIQDSQQTEPRDQQRFFKRLRHHLNRL